jgi:hypothetical protein
MRLPHLKSAIVLMAVLLTACSGEPSEKNIKAALSSYFYKQNQTIQEGAKFFGDSFAKKAMLELHSVKKLECIKKENDLGYLCAAEVDSTTPLAGRQKEVEKIRMIKNNKDFSSGSLHR